MAGTITRPLFVLTRGRIAGIGWPPNCLTDCCRMRHCQPRKWAFNIRLPTCRMGMRCRDFVRVRWLELVRPLKPKEFLKVGSTVPSGQRGWQRAPWRLPSRSHAPLCTSPLASSPLSAAGHATFSVGLALAAFSQCPIGNRPSLQHLPELTRCHFKQLARTPVDNNPMLPDQVERVQFVLAIAFGDFLGIFVEPSRPRAGRCDPAPAPSRLDRPRIGTGPRRPL